MEGQLPSAVPHQLSSGGVRAPSFRAYVARPLNALDKDGQSGAFSSSVTGLLCTCVAGVRQPSCTSSTRCTVILAAAVARETSNNTARAPDATTDTLRQIGQQTQRARAIPSSSRCSCPALNPDHVSQPRCTYYQQIPVRITRATRRHRKLHYLLNNSVIRRLCSFKKSIKHNNHYGWIVYKNKCFPFMSFH